QDDYTCGSLQPEPRGSRVVAGIKMPSDTSSDSRCSGSGSQDGMDCAGGRVAGVCKWWAAT
ncbi:MAG: hypothetical protein MUQ30_08560, partial [Anaerolineae bacterium]|nr:hypothetical protein [Anaerolineae bacterium]